MKDFLAAVRFLTIFPLPGGTSFSDRTMARSMAYFPLAGLAIGLLLLVARRLFGSFLPDSVVAILLIILLAVVTGALHLDGFSDTIDGLRSGKSRGEMLSIMRDSRVGAYGVAGLVCLLILQFALLTEIPRGTLGRSLILMATLSRWSMVQVCYGSIYARAEGGLGKPFVERLERGELVVSTTFAFIVAAGLFGIRGIAILAVNGVVNTAVKRYFHRKLGGITGDVLGATNEVSEIVSLMMILAMGA